MIGEAIDSIKKTEESAKNKVKEAQAEYDRMSRNARVRAEELLEESKKQVAAEAKLITEKAEEEAAQEVMLLKEKNETAKEEIRKTAESNQAEAASFIIGRVIK